MFVPSGCVVLVSLHGYWSLAGISTRTVRHRSFFELASKLFERTVVNHGTRVRYSGVTQELMFVILGCSVHRILQSLLIRGSTMYDALIYFQPLEGINKVYIFRYIYTCDLILFNYVFFVFWAFGSQRFIPGIRTIFTFKTCWRMKIEWPFY